MGLPQSTNTSLDLHQGWNWVGYLPEAPMPVTQALSSIDGLYARIIGDDGTYDVNIPPTFNTLKEMRPGAGYLIYMTQPGTLTYPAGAAALQSSPAQTSSDVELCPGLDRTPWFSEVYGQVNPAAAGQVLRAYDASGRLVGCARVREDGSYGLMRLYGQEDAAPSGLRFQLGDAILLTPPEFRWSPNHDLARLDFSVPPGDGGGHRLWLPLIGR
jgi:hypothetical protein